MPSNTRYLFRCPHCSGELTSLYAIYANNPIREKYFHGCAHCEITIEDKDAIPAWRPLKDKTAKMIRPPE